MSCLTEGVQEGTSQGSVLSCTCFMVAINDIISTISENVKSTLYVDDLTIYTSGMVPHIMVPYTIYTSGMVPHTTIYTSGMVPHTTIYTSGMVTQTTIYTSEMVPHISERRLQVVINRLENRCRTTSFVFPPAKAVVTHICQKRNCPKMANSLTMKNTNIRCVKNYKFLGVTFDSSLTWRNHITLLKASCHKTLNLLNIIVEIVYYVTEV